jgi:hypothetical protein
VLPPKRSVTLDVVIPAIRCATIDRLLRSFKLGTQLPEAISIITNEVPLDIERYGLNVRLLRFDSSTYPIGDGDLALRRDIGVWNSECSHVLTFDDDLIAPVNLVQTSRELLSREPYFWGHHRYVSFAEYSVEALSTMPPDRGRPRESPPNSWHLWMSCYGGLFGAETALVKNCGGFDLIYSCRQANEDQDFGKRLAHLIHQRERVFVYEPPFAWHPTEPDPWGQVRYSNLCQEGHDVVAATIQGIPVERCGKCPYLRAFDGTDDLRTWPVWPYDPQEVTVKCEYPVRRQRG